MRQHKILLTALLLLSPLQIMAERKTVLAQIQLPHNYYYREMYLPADHGPIGIDIFA